MKIELAEAQALVRQIETAIATGVGDCRSNEVVGELLRIAKAWVAEHAARPRIELAAVFPTERSEPPSQRLAAHHAATSRPIDPC